MKESNRKIYTVMSIAANNANYQETTFSTNMNKPISLATLTHDKLANLTMSKYGSKSLKSMSIYPALVWKPCRESLKPYLPFHVVKIERRRVYIRIDKKVFARLTNGPRLLKQLINPA